MRTARDRLFALLWAGVLALATLALAGHPVGHPLLRLTAACACVFWLPGALLVRLPHRLWEAVPLWTALSAAAATGLTILWTEAGWSVTAMAWLLLAAGWGGLAAGLLRLPEGLGRPSAPGLWVVAGLLLALLVWAFTLVGGWTTLEPYSEEALHLGIVRKIAEGPTLRSDRLMHQKGEVLTYGYAPYHAMLALTARLSGLDPIAVWWFLRPWLFLTAVAVASATVRLLLPGPAVLPMSLLCFSILVLENVAGQVALDEWYYWWAQMAPLTHPADFALGVLLPLLCYAFLRLLLLPEVGPGVALVAATAGAVLVIHPREAVHFLAYALALGVASLLFRRFDAGQFRCWVLGVAPVVTLGLLYRGVHRFQAPDVLVFEAAEHQRVLSQMSGGWLPSAPPDEVLFRPLYLGALLASPVLLLFCRHLWARFLGGALAAMACVVWIPGLRRFFVQLTYSEILATPARYFSYPAVLLAAVLAYLLYRWGDRLAASRPPGLVWPGLAAGSFLVGEFLVESLPDLPRSLLVGGFFALLGLAVALRAAGRGDPGAEPLPAPGRLRRPDLATAFCLAASLGLVALYTKPHLDGQITRKAQVPLPFTVERWYPATPTGRYLPYAVLQVLEREGRGKVVLAPYRVANQLPALVDLYVATAGIGWSTDLGRFLDAAQEARRKPVPGRRDIAARRRLYEELMAGKGPVYSESWTLEESLRLLRAMEVDLLLFSEEEHPRLSRAVREHPEAFRVVAEVEGWTLARVGPGKR